ncbi:exodeoxyribonuclease VII large subunit [Candidatus Nesciobacter abundans]|uniref:Exodeoxyribonuclease 7 large subunit n=1 Tax=Candidatus Nesciobacter abundans TaxID=2601668 RepID=A0A5C0UGY5_9PROT|nr:exodeoxyribonuclease VII large subunit [Candidatus Nesciobacter abundans]QEK39069.1 exodeoxyribonuclease VII large subunit [Candidatus Nesciobacter abundans]
MNSSKGLIDNQNSHSKLNSLNSTKNSLSDAAGSKYGTVSSSSENLSQIKYDKQSTLSTKNTISSDIETSDGVIGVKTLALSIKKLLESSYSKISIKGQVSQPKRSTHLYFSLKEEDAVIDCVCWANIKLKFEPQHDMEIICTGRVSSYPGRSKYQIVVLSVEHLGSSKILEERKEKLRKEGLFDPLRKPKLPKFPRKIGIITSPTGAVLHDMLHRLKDRYPCDVLLWPTAVQGSETVENVVSAIKGFNDKYFNEVDVIIIARGGGSFEDLWSFQDEHIVREISKSKIPIVTAIGHETDTTLSDYASSLRAPTPTASIELIFPDRKNIIREICDLCANKKMILKNTIKRKLSEMMWVRTKRFESVLEPFNTKLQNKTSLLEFSFSHYISKKRNLSKLSVSKPNFSCELSKIQHIHSNLNLIINHMFSKNKSKLDFMLKNLENASYHEILKRGFCRAFSDEKLIKSKKDAPESFSIEFYDGKLSVQKIHSKKKD